MSSNGTGSDTDLAFQAKLHDRGAYPIVAAVAVALVAFVGINLVPGNDARERSAAVSPSPSSSSTPAATLPHS